MKRRAATPPLEASLSQRNAEFAVIRELTADGLEIWNQLGSFQRRKITAQIATGQMSIPDALDRCVPSATHRTEKEPLLW